MEEKSFHFADLRPLSATAIFCGIIKVKVDAPEMLHKKSGIYPWQTHVFKDNSPNTDLTTVDLRSKECIKDLENYYYPGFVNCMFPEQRDKDPIKNNSRQKPFISKSVKGRSENNRLSVQSFTCPIQKKFTIKNHEVFIEYFDLLFFPENYLIYTFKCSYNNLTLDEIVELNLTIRDIDITKLEFAKEILTELKDGNHLNIGNKLKVFLYISHDFKFIDEYDADRLLLDLGTCSPIGTSVGKGKNPVLQYSKSYYKELLENNGISVFDNWTALSLFDTFVLVHRGLIYDYNWEFRYFRLLYIHSLFIKSFLVETNKEFYLDMWDKNLEDSFHEFNRYYNFKQISFNFLPQLIYEKIRAGLNIEHEMNDIRHAIERDHKKRQERREIEESLSENRIKNALFIVAILAVFTAVWDGSEWLYTVHEGKHGLGFNIISVSSCILIYSCILFFLLRKNK